MHFSPKLKVIGNSNIELDQYTGAVNRSKLRAWSVSGAHEKSADLFLTLKLTIKNRGVAPFYYNWTPEIALGDLHTRREVSGFNLSSLLPGQTKELTLKLALSKSESKTSFPRHPF